MNVNNAQNPMARDGYGVQNNGNGGSDLNNLFMTLLVAQIQNQDPLNPTDGTEYVSQLAQMTQVQSMETMSKLMQNNAILMDNLQVLSTAGLVGQQVMVQTDTVEIQDQEIEGRLTLSHNAGVVTVIVKDSAGVEHKIELGEHEAGQVNFTIDPAELGLAPGSYSLSVVTDVGEEMIPVEIAGTVNNVRIPLEGGSAVVNVSGLGDVPFYQISQFGSSSKSK
jgi:flagellar basal-body rod modification protein FlgD